MMRRRPVVLLALLAALSSACGGEAQEAGRRMVVSDDRELADLAAAMLPDLARRAGMELKAPVRIVRRSRPELERYLRHKLDEEIPEEEARATVAAYAAFGLVPDTLDLRALLLALYTEQVAGFYEPDSTALFVMDDQPAGSLQGLLIHELVHAVQDQSVNLDSLTSRELGNDRETAAQAAIEGHATLVMLEYMTEQMRGDHVDLTRLPDFGDQLRPALEGMRARFPALAGAPRLVQETLLFPYLEGTGFVQAMWSREGERTPPFGDHLPQSTEQVLERSEEDTPTELVVSVPPGARIVHEDVLGELEVGILLDAHAGEGAGRKGAAGWDGDRYVLFRRAGGARGLAWFSVWDDAAARDRFVSLLSSGLDGFPMPATLRPITLDGRPGAVLGVGAAAGAAAHVRAPEEGERRR